MKLVSIIMAVYNQAKTVEAALESIIAQTYSDWELILVEDASTDGSLDILKACIEKDNRVKLVINEKNIGLSASLNKAIVHCKGEYIARMDSDDICLPGRLSIQVKYLEAHPDIDILGGAAIQIDSEGRITGSMKSELLHDQLEKNIYKRCPFIHPTIMARRSFFLNEKYDEKYKRSEDYDLWLRTCRKYIFHNLDEPLIYYRVSKKINKKNLVYSALTLFQNIQREGKSVFYYFYILRIFGAYLKKQFKFR